MMEQGQLTSGKFRPLMLSITATMALVALAACSSEQPKPMAQPTPDQVRSHADQAFDKLKQDEKERAAQQ